MLLIAGPLLALVFFYFWRKSRRTLKLMRAIETSPIEQLSEGPVIAQESFSIKPGMTLKEIICAGQKIEAKVLVRAIRLFLSKQLDVYWGVVSQV